MTKQGSLPFSTEFQDDLDEKDDPSDISNKMHAIKMTTWFSIVLLICWLFPIIRRFMTFFW